MSQLYAYDKKNLILIINIINKILLTIDKQFL